MKKNILRGMLAALLLPASLFCSAQWSTGFESGIPKVCATEDLDGGVFSSRHYRNLDLGKGWQGGRFGTRGAVALCPGRLEDGNAVQRRLIVSDVAPGHVRWAARSAHPEFPDAYRVMVRKTGSEDWTEIFATEAENAQWTNHVVRMPETFLGDNVDVAIECVSRDGYLLCLDDLTIGELTDTFIQMEQRSPYFVYADLPGDRTCVTVVLTNYGKPILFDDLEVRTNEETFLYGKSSLVWSTGEDFIYSLYLTPEPGVPVTYSFRMLLGDEWIELGENTIFANHYPRNILLDKASATWCNNCPEGELVLEEFAAKYGDQLIPVCTHTGDIMVQPTYFSNLDFSAVPMYLVNRAKDSKSASTQMVRNAMAAAELTETFALIKSRVTYQGEEAELSHTVEFAKGLDNANDRYRLAYTVTRDIIGGDNTYAQSNAMNNSRYERFYYLPEVILPELMPYNHISSECATAFTGIPESLPSAIEPGVPYEYGHRFTLPANCADAKAVHVVTYILDTYTGEVLNAARADDITGIPEVAGEGDADWSWTIGGSMLKVMLTNEGAWQMDICTPEGMKVSSNSGSGSQACADMQGRKGIFLAVVRQGNIAKTFKFIN